MAGFGDQPAPRRAVDWRATDPGARLWPRREACGRGKGGRGDLSGDSNPAIDAGVDQHRLHRAPTGHLPRPAGSSGASDPCWGTQAQYARRGDVAGGQLLQPLVGASLSWRGAHPGDGSRAYRSSLVDGGVVDVCGATRRTAQMAWAKAEVAAGGRGCSLTTVPWDATAPPGRC